jgi:hypothetical protein
MASLELLECPGCGLLKVRQDLARSYKLCSPATSVGGTELAQGTVVCATCANQTRVGGQAVQLRATAALSAARHAKQTCAPGTEQRPASFLKRRSEQSVWEEALLAFEGSLPALAGGAEEVDEERKRWRPRSLKPPPNREAAISRVEAIQRDHLEDRKNVGMLLWAMNQDDPVRVDPELKAKVDALNNPMNLDPGTTTTTSSTTDLTHMTRCS